MFYRLQEEIERQHGLNDSLLEGAGGSAHDSSLEHERDADDDNRAEVCLTPPVLVVAIYSKITSMFALNYCLF